VRASLPVLARAATTLTKAPFEKFDFSEIQNTDRSLSRGGNSARLRVEELTRENSELKEQLGQVKGQKLKAEQELRRLEGVVEGMMSEVKRAKRIEIMYDEEVHQRMQLEGQVKAMSKELEEATRREKEVELVYILKCRGLEEDRDKERRAREKAEKELQEVRENMEGVRVQLSEGRRREEFAKEQWLRDLQDKERSEEEWERRMEKACERMKEQEEEIERLKRRLLEMAEMQVQQK
jgi:colicin import membrane protein